MKLQKIICYCKITLKTIIIDKIGTSCFIKKCICKCFIYSYSVYLSN